MIRCRGKAYKDWLTPITQDPQTLSTKGLLYELCTSPKDCLKQKVSRLGQSSAIIAECHTPPRKRGYCKPLRHKIIQWNLGPVFPNQMTPPVTWRAAFYTHVLLGGKWQPTTFIQDPLLKASDVFNKDSGQSPAPFLSRVSVLMLTTGFGNNDRSALEEPQVTAKTRFPSSRERLAVLERGAVVIETKTLWCFLTVLIDQNFPTAHSLTMRTDINIKAKEKPQTIVTTKPDLT